MRFIARLDVLVIFLGSFGNPAAADDWAQDAS
jgi:hypothetical protein